MSGDEYPGPGELSRQVREVLVRFETLGARLETQFVRADIFQLWRQKLEEDLKELIANKERDHKELEKSAQTERDHLVKRISDLEDNVKWFVRLVLGFVLLAVIGAAITLGKGGGAN